MSLMSNCTNPVQLIQQENNQVLPKKIPMKNNPHFHQSEILEIHLGFYHF